MILSIENTREKPSVKSTDSNQKVQELLEQGLTLFGVGKEKEAIDCWLRALQFDPGCKEAQDYLESAGVSLPAPEPRAVPPRATSREAISTPTKVASLRGWSERQRTQLLETLDVILEPQDVELPHGNCPDAAGRFVALVDGKKPLRQILALLDCPAPEFWELVRLCVKPGTLERGKSETTTNETPNKVKNQPVALPSFEECFESALKCALARDFAKAKEWYEVCLKIRPGEPRVIANLKKVDQALKGKKAS